MYDCLSVTIYLARFEENNKLYNTYQSLTHSLASPWMSRGIRFDCHCMQAQFRETAKYHCRRPSPCSNDCVGKSLSRFTVWCMRSDKPLYIHHGSKRTANCHFQCPSESGHDSVGSLVSRFIGFSPLVVSFIQKSTFECREHMARELQF